MLSTSLTEPIISIDVKLGIDDAHSWSVSFFSNSDMYQIGAEVSIYRDGTLLLVGAVTGYSYDAKSQTMTISGTDKTSYTDQYDRRETTLATDSLTTVSAAIESVKSGSVLSCPNISCFGYGSYGGNTQSFVDRVANAFGLNWFANPVGAGYYLTSGDIPTPSSGNALPGWNYSSSNNYDDRISTIYVQKAITNAGQSKIAVKNAGTAATQTVRLQNPNAVAANAGAAQFPMDYFICPWTKSFVTIDVPVSNTVYNQATDIGSVKQVTVLGCSDSIASPAWRLELWDRNPGAGTATGTKLATLSVGQTWTASGDETATYARVARTVVSNGISAVEYPHYDGVEITAYTWAEVPGAQVEAWSDSFASGDTGRPDYNVISDEMYPNHALFVSQGLGMQIAGRDSVTARRSFVTPGTPSIVMKSGYKITIDGTDVVLPATSINYSAAAGVDQTEIAGEW